MKTRLCFAVSISLTIGLVICGASAQSSIIHGQVVDQNGAVIMRAEVLIEDIGRKITLNAVTDTNGRFRLSVTKSIYSLKVKKAGFCVSERNVFEVLSEESIQMNARLVICTIETNIVVGDPKSNSGTLQKYRSPFKRETVQLSSAAEKNSEVWIEYGFKELVGSRSIFMPPRSNDTPRWVRLTYNKTQIFAEKITSLDPSFYIAEGEVWLEDGSTSRRFEKLIIALNGAKTEIVCANTTTVQRPS